MKLYAVFLIVLTSADMCALENIDDASPTYIKMNSIADCEAMAKSIDDRPSMRAFCFDPKEPNP